MTEDPNQRDWTPAEKEWIAKKRAELQAELARRERLWKEIVDSPMPSDVRDATIRGFMTKVLDEPQQSEGSVK